jgi:hypothetical protein
MLDVVFASHRAECVANLLPPLLSYEPSTNYRMPVMIILGVPDGSV